MEKKMTRQRSKETRGEEVQTKEFPLILYVSWSKNVQVCVPAAAAVHCLSPFFGRRQGSSRLVSRTDVNSVMEGQA